VTLRKEEEEEEEEAGVFQSQKCVYSLQMSASPFTDVQLT